MSFDNKKFKQSKTPFEKCIDIILDFCRQFGIQGPGIDKRNVRQLSFDSIRLANKHKVKIAEINEFASNTIKEHHNDVNGLLEFIENRGTKVIRHPKADWILKLLGKEEGFVPPMKSIKGKIMLTLLKIIGAWNGQTNITSPPLFIFGEKEPAIGTVIYQLYHWLSYNDGLPGYSDEAMRNFNKIFSPSFGMQDIQRMSREEIVQLREAIARDQAALSFVQKMAIEFFKPKDVIQGLKDGGKTNI